PVDSLSSPSMPTLLVCLRHTRSSCSSHLLPPRAMARGAPSLTPSLSDGEEWFLASMQRLITELKLAESGRAATIICLGSAADAKTIRSLGARSRIEVVHLEVCGGTAVDIACDPGHLPLCDG